jgi:hypothetical protein
MSTQNTTPQPNDVSAERHYTIDELSELWHLSYDVVKRLVEKEPGVLIFHSDGTLKKRKYTTIRVPDSVKTRVHRKLRAQ